MLERVRQRADEFDFLHFHLDYYPFSIFSRQPTPFMTTLHGRLDLPEHQPLFATFPSAPIISISDAQRRPIPNAGWIKTIYHGLPEKLLVPQPGKKEYLAFLGRIAPEKRVDRAIRIARECGIPLKIAAKIDRVDREYYDEQIRPMIDGPDIEYIGEITDGQKAEFLGGAKALLTPIDWPEPFGLVMIEAMACGTPVIAFNRGSVPEVVGLPVVRTPPCERPQTVRGALYRASHGPGLSGRLSQPDESGCAAPETGGKRNAFDSKLMT
jgi:glycosyltransferase involved in cell wall biosynthesis